MGVADLIFEVVQESDGGFVAECLTEPIVTQADDWVALREAVFLRRTRFDAQSDPFAFSAG